MAGANGSTMAERHLNWVALEEATMPSLALDQLFSEFIGSVPGVSAALVKDGELQTVTAFGLSNLEQNSSATPTTNYRLASVSKQFTAMAILLLVADGRLTLDDPLARFFDSSPPFWQHITLRHMLTHTSGLLDYEDMIAPATTTQLHDDDVLDLLRPHDAGYHVPGTAFCYSNTAYCLLALIAAQVADQPFASLLRERIFLPCGMTNTVAYEAGISEVAQRAYGYSLRDHTWTRTDQSLTSATLGDGGIYSSIHDLARWDAALAINQLLPKELMAQLYEPHVAIGNGEHYGFGWYLRGSHVAYHTGETIGFRTAIIRRLDRRLTAIVLTNHSDATPLALAEALIDAAMTSE